MSKEKLHIGNWEVCCSDMASALIDDRIQATDPKVEELIFTIQEGNSLNCCPWCKETLFNTAHQHELDLL